MRYKLFITICSAALISASAHAYDINYSDDAASPNDNAPAAADNSGGVLVEPQQNMMMAPAPRSLPVARDGEVIDSVGGGATEAEMPVTQKSANGIVYITGGVGDEEKAELNDLESSYNTRVVMIATNGEYMSEITLRVLDKGGKEILRVENAGPIFLANLPNGAYTLEAAASSGAIKSAKFSVPAKNPKVKTVIRFDE